MVQRKVTCDFADRYVYGLAVVSTITLYSSAADRPI